MRRRGPARNQEASLDDAAVVVDDGRGTSFWWRHLLAIALLLESRGQRLTQDLVRARHGCESVEAVRNAVK